VVVPGSCALLPWPWFFRPEFLTPFTAVAKYCKGGTFLDIWPPQTTMARTAVKIATRAFGFAYLWLMTGSSSSTLCTLLHGSGQQAAGALAVKTGGTWSGAKAEQLGGEAGVQPGEM
jgi:hypothetical protein